MKRSPEILAGFLEVIDDITRATQSALETLQSNAETTQMIISEIMSGSTENNFGNKFSDMFSEEEKVHSATIRSNPRVSDEDNLNYIADQVIEKIRSHSNNSGVLIMCDSANVDVKKVMEIVNKKMQKEDKKGEDIDESINFKSDFDEFDNPFK